MAIGTRCWTAALALFIAIEEGKFAVAVDQFVAAASQR